MEFFRRIFRPSKFSLYSVILPMLLQLYKEYRSVGLLPGMSQKEFESAVQMRIDQDELQDMNEAWNEGDKLSIRTNIAGQVFGIKSDWRFDREEVLEKAKELLKKDNLDLNWKIIKTEGIIKDGRKYQENTISLTLNDGLSIQRQYCLLPGLMTGINDLLQLGRKPNHFIGLATDGDYYVYVYASSKTEETMETSGLFKLSQETDPVEGWTIIQK